MGWKEYEREILDIFRDEYPKSEVTHNISRKGKYSKGQIRFTGFAFLIFYGFYAIYVIGIN